MKDVFNRMQGMSFTIEDINDMIGFMIRSIDTKSHPSMNEINTLQRYVYWLDGFRDKNQKTQDDFNE